MLEIVILMISSSTLIVKMRIIRCLFTASEKSGNGSIFVRFMNAPRWLFPTKIKRKIGVTFSLF